VFTESRNMSSRERKEMGLKFGEKYSRREISDLLGKSMVAYLPYKDGHILCGCFDRSRRFNPDAPEEVLYGPAPIVEETAEMIYRQGSAIPIFIRRSPGEWEYVGYYRCIGHSRDPNLLKKRRNKYPERGRIAGVLRFKKE
jgi:hypothetical protein